MNQKLMLVLMIGTFFCGITSVMCPPKKRSGEAVEDVVSHGGAGSDVSFGTSASGGRCSSLTSRSCSPLSMSWSRPSSAARSVDRAALRKDVFVRLDCITAALREGFEEKCALLEGYDFPIDEKTRIYTGHVKARTSEWERKDILDVVASWWELDRKITTNKPVDIHFFIAAVDAWVRVLGLLEEDRFRGLKEKVVQTVFKFASGYLVVRRDKKWICTGCIENIRRIFTSIAKIATTKSRTLVINEVLNGLDELESIVG